MTIREDIAKVREMSFAHALANKRWVYDLDETTPDPTNDQRPGAEPRYLVIIAVENQPGYYSMAGDPAKLQVPWYWTKTVVAKMNRERGYSEMDAIKIVLSAINAQNRR